MVNERSLVLMLEDDDERIRRFRKVLAIICHQLSVLSWSNAHQMIGEVDQYLSRAALLTLDHDLYVTERRDAQGKIEPAPDPGDGLEVARFLAARLPQAPIIIHSSNVDRAWSMYNELHYAGWHTAVVGPIGEDWIETAWVRRVCKLFNISYPVKES